jgi:hypothetical protein
MLIYNTRCFYLLEHYGSLLQQQQSKLEDQNRFLPLARSHIQENHFNELGLAGQIAPHNIHINSNLPQGSQK